MTSRNHRGFQEKQGQGRNLTLGFLSGLDKQNQEENRGDQDEQNTSDKAEIIYLHELTPLSDNGFALKINSQNIIPEGVADLRGELGIMNYEL